MLRAFGTTDELDPREVSVHLPRPSRLEAPLQVAPAKAAKGVAALGIETVGDLIEHFPFRHDDRREVHAIADLAPGEPATISVEIRRIAARRTRRRNFSLVEATVADATGVAKAVWFNQPWVVGKLPAGTRVLLHGRAERRNQFRVEEYQVGGAGGAPGLVPVYPANADVSPAKLRELALGWRGATRHVLEPLPAALRGVETLADRPAAIAAVHFPEAPDDYDAGRRRLAFDELLLMQLTLLRRRAQRRARANAPAIEGPRALRRLPFELTDDQRAAIDVIFDELAQERPMQRLLMGEVGSGKTVVALQALLRAADHGFQGALMAPTETLAEQHFITIQRLLPEELVQVSLLTGSTPGKRRADILGRLATGELPLVVGTHALIVEEVEFARLAVAVVDEQHRFGVRQRAALDAKAPAGQAPHVLHMTATPIPRTLALTAYGDLDVTTLRTLPRGRKPVETHVASSERERSRAYERIREELHAGRQAYVVCPLVEESEALQARAATQEFERLRGGELRDFDVVLMHGQMRPTEKQAAMERFAGGEADVLVATSVIEVGIDVANATVMLVEDADRYGISQLHQLRGRVGRGEHPSLCLLFGPKTSPRLQAVAEHHDGFRLAEIDLELRGEGELAGVRQHGVQAFRVARLPEDMDLLLRAREHAERLLASDPDLSEPEHALLADAVIGAYGSEALDPIPA